MTDIRPTTQLIVPTTTLTSLRRLAKTLPKSTIDRVLSLADRDARRELATRRRRHADGPGRPGSQTDGGNAGESI